MPDAVSLIHPPPLETCASCIKATTLAGLAVKARIVKQHHALLWDRRPVADLDYEDMVVRKLLDDLLYELRMRFVQAQQGQKRIITP